MIKVILFDAQGVLYVHGRLDPNLGAFIREKGDQFKFAVCTSSGQSIRRALENDRIADKFDLILTADDTDLQKTDPALYKYIAQEMDVKPEEILFLDDIVPFVRAARKAGVRAIHYTDPESFSLGHAHQH